MLFAAATVVVSQLVLDRDYTLDVAGGPDGYGQRR
jgi:hypothetical protein